LRLPQKNENRGWQENHQPPPQARPQRTDKSLIRHTFPKSLRLLNRYQYEKLCRRGTRLFGTRIVLDVCEEKKKALAEQPSKLGITVTKKFGKAHDRNRFKRVVREAFRLCQNRLRKGLEINVRPAFSFKTDPYSLTTQEVIQEIVGLVKQES